MKKGTVDPNEALRRARDALSVLRNCDLAGRGEEQDAIVAMVANFGALDGWLSKGGALPDAWITAGQLRICNCGHDPCEC